METYIPSPSSGGILGGKGDGEVDSIQAWKKDMPEESKDYIALDSRESIEVILNFFYLML